MRRRREPTPAELTLWGEVARSVRPISAAKHHAKPHSNAKPNPKSRANSTAFAPQAQPELNMAQLMAETTVKALAKSTLNKSAMNKVASPRTVPQPVAAYPSPSTPLDTHLRKALKRGTRPVEAVIDLHGMRQDEAHPALMAFMHRCHSRGLGLVLVVTGKGLDKESGSLLLLRRPHNLAASGRERGILRRLVPHWLQLPELRPFIIGFDEAHQNHGGAGALYVRLRRANHRNVSP